MADFCNICTTTYFYEEIEQDNISDTPQMDFKVLDSDININKLFDEYIKTDMENFLSNEFYGLNVSGICEHCGLSRLTIKKENDIIYLVAWCYKYSKEKNTGKYKIAIINEDNELNYQIDEINKYFNEH